MKRILAFSVLVILLFSVPCSAVGLYPPRGPETISPEITERINIIFDNSGHDEVKDTLVEVFIASTIAEHSEIWLYPIAGSNAPIRIEPNQDFVEANFVKYSKSSNEFKPENMIEKALSDLQESTHAKKRLILYADLDTAELRSEYSVMDWYQNYIRANPDILFSTVYSGTMVESTFYPAVRIDLPGISNDAPDGPVNNYESKEGSFRDFILTKNGYSPCEFSYERESGVLTLGKGKVDRNIFVFAEDGNAKKIRGGVTSTGLFLGGCAMGESKYQDYIKKSKVKGVALSYNHVVAEWTDDDSNFAAALYTLDGESVNPQAEGVYIPLLNARNVSVYHKETPETGLCSADTSYDSSFDKKLVNIYAPDGVDGAFAAPESVQEVTAEPEPISIGAGISSLIRLLVGIVRGFLRLLILLFVVLFFAYPRFRSNIMLKVHESRFGRLYDRIEAVFIRLKKELFGGAKVRGISNINGKFVFISKKTEDMESGNSRASLVVEEMKSRGIGCWLSETGIDGGEDHNDIIPRAIKACAFMVVFISTRSVASVEVIKEVKQAQSYNKKIIPVLIENFDLFKKYENWSFMLQTSNKLDLFSSKPEKIKALVDKIEKKYNEI